MDDKYTDYKIQFTKTREDKSMIFFLNIPVKILTNKGLLYNTLDII